jgi:hypothetical protein
MPYGRTRSIANLMPGARQFGLTGMSSAVAEGTRMVEATADPDPATGLAAPETLTRRMRRLLAGRPGACTG